MRVLRQFNNLLIYVLLVAAFVTLWLRDYLDAAVILGVVVINAIIGFVQEGKAERALDAVRAMLASRATVLRGGDRHEIDAADLVPGDVVLLESGARVPADLRLLRTKNLRIDESALTGESVPAEKDAAPVAPDAPLGDRLCMAFAGTTVAVGQASGVVVATARQTEIGQIGALVSDVGSLATPLTRRLDQFARQITLVIGVVSVITFLYGYLRRRPAAAGAVPRGGGPGRGRHSRRPAGHRDHHAGHRHAPPWRASARWCGACRRWRRWARSV